MAKPTLIKSTSGIRGIVGNGLDSEIAENYARSFGVFVKKGTMVVGRDSRPSGEMLSKAVFKGLSSVGINVINLGIVPTPTVEIAVKELKAAAGICITASHNPAQWNALKFFNNRGEFITSKQFDQIEKIHNDKSSSLNFSKKTGKVKKQAGWVEKHIRKTMAIRPINIAAIKKSKFTIVVDAINGAGSFALPKLLEKLGAKVIKINCRPDGNFVHEPEPTPKNLKQLGDTVKKHKADFGLACDPDADRLAIVDEKGKPIGEELTLAIAVREALKTHKKSPVVTNLSTSRVTTDEAIRAGCKFYLSRVGESNVVQLMHEKKAAIGGEGNGGVIYPPFHAGRDALVAAALVLSCAARENLKMSKLGETFNKYYTIKTKASLKPDFSKRLSNFEKEVNAFVKNPTINHMDGLRVDFPEGWLLIRQSNTEPIFRLMVETNDAKTSTMLSKKIMKYFA